MRGINDDILWCDYVAQYMCECILTVIEGCATIGGDATPMCVCASASVMYEYQLSPPRSDSNKPTAYQVDMSTARTAPRATLSGDLFFFPPRIGAHGPIFWFGGVILSVRFMVSSPYHALNYVDSTQLLNLWSHGY